MIKAENTKVEIDGKRDDLLVECACMLTAVTYTISEGNSDFANAAIYSIVMAAADELRNKGLDIDTSFLGIQIVNATKEDNK